MSERFSNQLQSLLLALTVVLLVVTFASQFGGMQSQGCATSARPAVEAAGQAYTLGAFTAVMRLGYGRMEPDQLEAAHARENVANGMAERALLAREARRIGMDVEADDALVEVLRTGRVYNSISVDAPSYARQSPIDWGFRDEEGAIDRDRLDDLLGRLGRSSDDFAAWQAEELLAERMRDLIRSSVTVAPGEVWDRYASEHDKASFRYIRFRASYYGDRLDPTDAELDAFVASHAQRLTDEYTSNRTRFQALEEQVRARHILIKVAEGADDAAKAAARARIDAILPQARAADSRGFAALARRYSEDTGSGRKGGDLGWNPRGRMVPPFDAAQFALQPGQTSAVIETDFGFHIIRVEGRRSGDVPEAAAKRELAEPLYRAEKGREEAERAATAMLARLRGGTPMETIATELTPAPVEGQPAPEADPDAPHVATASDTGPGDAPEYGWSAGSAVTAAAFTLNEEGDLVSAPVQAGDDYAVLELDSRERPVREDLTASERARILGQLRTAKEDEAVVLFTQSLRERARRDGGIDIDPNVLAYPAATAPARSGSGSGSSR